MELRDGSRIDPDLVITATGYLPRFEFLEPDLLDIDADGRPDLHLHAFARRHPTLAVVGLVQPDSGVLFRSRTGRAWPSRGGCGCGKRTGPGGRGSEKESRVRPTSGGPRPRWPTRPGTGSRSATSSTCGPCKALSDEMEPRR